MSQKKLIKLIQILVLINGASITALEITASRVLAPYFGTTLLVWGSIIGITLIALASGYFFGGRIADQQVNLEKVGFITLIAAVLTIIIPLISKPILSFLLNNLLETNFVVLIGALVGSIILFALPIALMGMISPMTVKIASNNLENIGQTVGSLYSLATVGSILGVFLPSFILVPLLGSSQTILIFAFLELLISLLVIKQKSYLLFLFLPLIVTLAGGKIYPNSLFETESAYQTLAVYQNGAERELRFNEGSGVQSIFDHNRALKANRYWDYAVLFPYFFPEKKQQDYLIIGAAGGTMATNIRDHVADKEVNVLGLEIDPQVVWLAKKYFDADGQALKYQIGDARVSLQQLNRKFDLIIIDAYTQQHYLPPHLVTTEFFQEVKKKLNTKGVVIANINARSTESSLFKAITTTLNQVFSQVSSVSIPETYNYLVFATDKDDLLVNFKLPLKFKNLAEIMKNNQRIESRGLILTDNHSPVEWLTDQDIYQEYFSK